MDRESHLCGRRVPRPRPSGVTRRYRGSSSESNPLPVGKLAEGIPGRFGRAALSRSPNAGRRCCRHEGQQREQGQQRQVGRGGGQHRTGRERLGEAGDRLHRHRPLRQARGEAEEVVAVRVGLVALLGEAAEVQGMAAGGLDEAQVPGQARPGQGLQGVLEDAVGADAVDQGARLDRLQLTAQLLLGELPVQLQALAQEVAELGHELGGRTLALLDGTGLAPELMLLHQGLLLRTVAAPVHPRLLEVAHRSRDRVRQQHEQHRPHQQQHHQGRGGPLAQAGYQQPEAGEAGQVEQAGEMDRGEAQEEVGIQLHRAGQAEDEQVEDDPHGEGRGEDDPGGGELAQQQAGARHRPRQGEHEGALPALAADAVVGEQQGHEAEAEADDEDPVDLDEVGDDAGGGRGGRLLVVQAPRHVDHEAPVAAVGAGLLRHDRGGQEVLAAEGDEGEGARPLDQRPGPLDRQLAETAGEPFEPVLGGLQLVLVALLGPFAAGAAEDDAVHRHEGRRDQQGQGEAQAGQVVGQLAAQDRRDHCRSSRLRILR